ncbi:hypothetical protein ACIRQP_02710 [Streptomyces sp. NPDC102274]|uniref:hypothetical protein n=1 Tax=Streptomyces sp. NPDC102274 TaxID=3366151 RepID=UPI00381BBDCF
MRRVHTHAVKELAHRYRRIAVASRIAASGAVPLEPTDEVCAATGASRVVVGHY